MLSVVLTNSKCLADELNLKYFDQQAQRTEGTKAVKKLGSISGSIGYDCYSFKSSMYKSVSKELNMKQSNSTPILMLQAGTTSSNNHLVGQWHEAEVAAGDRLKAWDGLTGLLLDPKGVLNARRQELDYIAKKKVWEVVPREGARRNGWEIIKSIWIDINKGDDIAAQCGSRFVGKGFADKKIDGLFAGTPPLEALRFLVHEAATVEG